MRDRRVLFLPVNVLSSITRQLICARAFREKGYSVCFAGQGDYLEMARQEGFAVHDLLTFEIGKIVDRIRLLDKRIPSMLQFARWAWKEIDLERFVRHEVSLFRRLAPDLVISEERISAVLSARIVGVPHGSIRNAYRTPYSIFPLLDFSDTPLEKLVPDPRRIELGILKFFSYPFLWRMNRVLHAHGVRHRMDFKAYVESDDLVFLCDVPEFSPAGILPPNYNYVGPLFWKGGGSTPEWLESLGGRENVVYVSLGSTGTPELLEAIVRALEGKGYTLIITFGDLRLPDLPAFRRPGVFAERFISAEPVLTRASAVLCHAGNGTIYQALDSGVPVIGIPTHLEQRFNAQRLQAMGLGRTLELDQLKARPECLVRILQGILNDEHVQINIRRFRKRIRSFNAPQRIVELTDAFLDAAL